MGTFEHAIVLGSGMAGLVSARVLSDHFDRVTIYEKDPDPQGPGFRSGIPQGRHFHALIPGGLVIMAELFPGLQEDLKAAGSIVPKPDQFYFYTPMGKSYSIGAYVPEPPPDTGAEVLFVQTRGLLEFTIRNHVSRIDNIELVYDEAVKDLAVTDKRVTGIQLASGNVDSADLVIDAMGRQGRTLTWLKELGYPQPVEDVITCDFAYSSVFMKPKDPSMFKDVGFFVSADPNGEHPRRGGALVRMEDGTWLTSVGGRYGDYPPRDIDGFRAFVETLPDTSPYKELVRQCEPVDEIAHYRFPANRRRHFEQLDEFPEGLLPIGDAICHYNPLYGQGMTAACRQAMALRATLAAAKETGDSDGLWRSFFPEAYQETRAPWLFAAQTDFNDPLCTGDFPEEERHMQKTMRYMTEQIQKGNSEAGAMMGRIGSLMARLDVLEQSHWAQDANA